jgi:hypothetical protein
VRADVDGAGASFLERGQGGGIKKAARRAASIYQARPRPELVEGVVPTSSRHTS